MRMLTDRENGERERWRGRGEREGHTI